LVDALTGNKQLDSLGGSDPAVTVGQKMPVAGEQPYLNRDKLVAALAGSRPEDTTPALSNLLFQRAMPAQGFTGTLPEGGTAFVNGVRVAEGNPKEYAPDRPTMNIIDPTVKEGYRTIRRADFKEPMKEYMKPTGGGGIAGMLDLTPRQNEALFGEDGAVTTGKLSPDRVNSRTAKIYANAYILNPKTDMNNLATDAALMRNSAYMGRQLSLETIPTVLGSMVEAGKKVNYSDAKIVGEMQKFFKGQTNDPDLATYMAIRNDSLLSIAATMRGVGMSDQAHMAEIEAQNPTMSPRALDGWLTGQTKALEPKLKLAHRFTRSGEASGNPYNQPNPAAGTAPPEAIAKLKSDPSLAPFFKAKYGYLPQ
jgi:hypothetical protein